MAENDIVVEFDQVPNVAADNARETAGRNQVQSTHGYNLHQSRSTWRDLHRDYGVF